MVDFTEWSVHVSEVFTDTSAVSSAFLSTSWQLGARESPYAKSPQAHLHVVETLRWPCTVGRTLKTNNNKNLSLSVCLSVCSLPLLMPLSLPGDRWFDVLGFVTAGGASSFSTVGSDRWPQASQASSPAMIWVTCNPSGWLGSEH